MAKYKNYNHSITSNRNITVASYEFDKSYKLSLVSNQSKQVNNNFAYMLKDLRDTFFISIFILAFEFIIFYLVRANIINISKLFSF